MKTIVLRSTNNQFRVEIKTDLSKNEGAFTIMEFVGKDDSEVVAGMSLKELPSSFEGMKAFATSNNLLMDIIDINEGTNTAVVSSVTALAITSSGALTAGNDTVAYSETIAVEGGNGPLTFEVTDGSLPSGLSLQASTGTITGIPDTVENPTFEITATDAFGQSSVEAGLSIDIQA